MLRVEILRGLVMLLCDVGSLKEYLLKKILAMCGTWCGVLLPPPGIEPGSLH